MKKLELNKKIDDIIMIGFILILFIYSFIGYAGNDNYKIPQIAISILFFVYIICGKIFHKRIKVIRNIQDICVLVLCCATIIPLVFKTYASFYETIDGILKYLNLFMVYVFIKEICYENKKYINWLINAFIIDVFILIIVGIDNLTTNLFSYLLTIIGTKSFVNGDSRLISVIGYSNSFAALISMAFFVCISKCLVENSNYKKCILYNILFIFMVGIFLTYSKGVFLLIPFAIIIYFILIKEKTKFIKYIIPIFIFALIYLTIFEKIKQYSFLNWIILLMFLIINSVIFLLLEKIKNIKINKKKIISLTLSFLLIFIIYTIFAVNLDKEYIVFSNLSEDKLKVKVINNIKGLTNYVLKFDINSESPFLEGQDIYKINIIERDDKNKKIKSHEINFGKIDEVKSIEIFTSNETAEFRIEFTNSLIYSNGELTVRSLYMNEEKVKLEYKLLPTKLVQKIKNISINYKTAKERIVFISDALKLASENLITGIGEGGWKYRYCEVQQYNYISSQTHSYPAQVLLEFGIIGIIAYTGIGITLLINLRTKKGEIYSGILIGIGMILVHSIFDMDLTFNYILFSIIIFIAIINSLNDKKNIVLEKNTKYIIIWLGIILIQIILFLNPKIYNKVLVYKDNIKNENTILLNRGSEEYYKYFRNKIIDLKNIEEYEKYFKKLEIYKTIIYSYLDSDVSEKDTEIIKYCNLIINYKNNCKKNHILVVEKSEIIWNVIGVLEQSQNTKYNSIINDLINTFFIEYNEVKNELNKLAIEEYGNDKIYKCISDLQNTYNLMLIKSKNYFNGIKVYNNSGLEISEDILEKSENTITTKDILVYHTHTTEAYHSEENYIETKFHKTINEKYNIIEVGRYFTECLEKKEYNVLHDTTYYDLPTNDKAYHRSFEKINKIIEKNKNYKVIFDIHRDAYTEKKHKAETVLTDEGEAAKIMLVVGIDESKDWISNLKWAITIQKKADEVYPNLFKPMLISKYTYNQDLSDYEIIVEVGEDYNYIDEAKVSVKCLANIIDQIIIK